MSELVIASNEADARAAGRGQTASLGDGRCAQAAHRGAVDGRLPTRQFRGRARPPGPRYGGRVMFPIVTGVTIVPILFIAFFAIDSYALLLVGGFFLGIAGTVSSGTGRRASASRSRA